MTPSVRATSVSVGLALLLALGVARGQDKPAPQPPPTVKVPAGTAPEMDGVVGAEEWKDAAPFEVRLGEELLAKARIKRVARQLFVACETEFSPWALGVRLNLRDPVSRRSNAVLVTPLNPPLPPLSSFRQVEGREPEPVSCTSADARFSFPDNGGVGVELRIPMDLLEFARSSKTYAFSFELWDLEARRPMALFPGRAAGIGRATPMARLQPADTWGADAASEEEPPEHPALKLLEELGTDKGVLIEASGWQNGRRKDEPLARLQERLEKAISAYPDYISLRAAGVQAAVARGDLARGLAALDRLGADFPRVAVTPRHLLIRTEFLRNLERPDEALAYLDAHAEHVKGDPLAQRERVVIQNLREGLRMEREIRRREAERDDLPRVSIKTSKGEIVIELFEDDAPNGVANFISLVESGFYVGTRFFWCEGGRRVLAGDPNTRDEDPHNDGFGDPGYLIESEPGRRLNLAYMVAFTDQRRARRTEGCTFVIHMAPFPALDGVNTVFGRVIEGHATVRKLEYYDTIEATKVVRKRDHEYVPVKRPPRSE